MLKSMLNSVLKSQIYLPFPLSNKIFATFSAFKTKF